MVCERVLNVVTGVILKVWSQLRTVNEIKTNLTFKTKLELNDFYALPWM